MTTIIHDIGIRFGFWVVQDAAYPLYEILPYFYGLIPVLTMWVFKFTNGRFWIYMLTNAILDIGFAFYFLGTLLPSWGIYALVGITSFQVWLINLGHATMLYLYQKWQESEFALGIKRKSSPIRQAAATKPLFNKKDDTIYKR